MTICRQIEQELLQILEGSLSRERGAEIEEHLESCSECRALLARYSHLFERSAETERDLPAEKVWRSLQSRINREESSGKSRTLTWQPAVFLSAKLAGLVLATGLGIFLGNLPTSNQSSDEALLVEDFTVSLSQESALEVAPYFYETDQPEGESK